MPESHSKKLHVENTNALGTTETALQSARDLVLNGEHLDVVKQLESLGIQHRCAEGMEDRVKESLLVSRRIRWAPLP